MLGIVHSFGAETKIHTVKRRKYIFSHGISAEDKEEARRRGFRMAKNEKIKNREQNNTKIHHNCRLRLININLIIISNVGTY